eukprot:m.477824 g.477824  ORF g.477824 m.477824 type:complete len:882 (-) comp20952_c0_seq1:269-2914(-)
MGDDFDPSQADREDQTRLMDDFWQRQQIKTFTAWVNSHLRKRNESIADIGVDLCDGRLLMVLLELLGDAKLPKPAKGKMRIHKIQNVGAAFQYIKEVGVKLVSIAPEEIVDGNMKMILGMIWTLILRFEIQDISMEEMSAKDALLLWCQRKTQPYNNVSVDNFHMSFKDGLAFCALIHRHRPELINYDSLRRDDPATNFATAFEVADKELDIPPMLDAEDMINCVKPDERSVMTYVAAYYKAFASSNKNEVAAKKIATVLETNREHERLIEEFETRASDLLAWIAATVERLGQREALDTVDACQVKLTEHNAFRGEEYPPKLEEKGELEAHYSTLQTKLRLSGRPAYVPSEGRLISDIDGAWGGLDSADAEHKAWVLDELKRNQLVENKAARFEAKSVAHETWTAGKEEALRVDDYSSANLSGVMALKKKHEGFQSDLLAHETRVHEIGTLANELDELRYHRAEEINDRYAAIYENWQLLVQLTNERQGALDAAEEKQQQIETLRVEYARDAPNLVNQVERAQETLTDAYIVDTVSEAEALVAEHETFKSSTIAELTGAYDALSALSQQLTDLGTGENPYTQHPYDAVSAKWQALLDAVPARDQQLAEELQRQQSREELRVSWAQKAAESQDWFAAKEQEVVVVIEQAEYEKLEDQLAALQALEADVTAYASSMAELESLNSQVQDALVFTNPHTTITIELLRGLRQKLSSKIRRSVTELENQILTRDSKNLSEDQLREYRESFKHFDKNNSGQLDRLEFRGCLISLEYDVPQVAVEGKDQQFESVWARVDPDNSGYVSFDEFIAFMVEEHADAETSDQLVEAFKVLAGSRDYVLAEELQRELPADLAEYCIQNMSPFEGGPEGALDYLSFAGALYGQSDL